MEHKKSSDNDDYSLDFEDDDSLDFDKKDKKN